ncbi:MAG: hypothetical protein K2N38_13945, partial [Oscillospiraceae bacterium]|nr:hypothetical protein [Oscillospiraceae bacterium]
AAPRAPEKPAEKPTEPSVPLQDAPEAITPGEWSAAVSKLDFVTSAMLANSTAQLVNGQLTIRSSNSMLLNNAKGEELSRIEKAVSEALGYAVRLKLEEAQSSPETAEAAKNPLERMLDKARELGVEVNIKK